MKNKVLAMMIVVSLAFSLCSAYQAKAVETGGVSTAKTQIDTILEKSPTVEEYTEDIADAVTTLGSLIKDMPEEEIAQLDAYVEEKTVIPGSGGVSTGSAVSGTSISGSGIDADTESRYTSVQAFYQAYKEAQDAYMAEQAGTLDEQVKQFMAIGITREGYERLLASYQSASVYVKNEMDSEHVNSMNQLRELMNLADKAVVAVGEISALTSLASYEEFTTTLAAAQTTLNTYYSKYTELRRFQKFQNCLTKALRDTLITNIKKYTKANLMQAVEIAYDEVGVFDKMTEKVKEKIAALSQALKNANDSEFGISVYDFYNGEAMQFVLDEYDHIVKFEKMLSNLPETPSNTTELAAALRAYDFYLNQLTEDEKNFVEESYKIKLTNAVQVNTNCNDVISAIDQIGSATGSAAYAEYAVRYENAYMLYQSFIKRYNGVSGISDLITNEDVLNDATQVLELIKSIRNIEQASDDRKCSLLVKMDAVKISYDNMKESLKEQVYNMPDFDVIYQDTQTAYQLSQKIINLKTYTLQDEPYIVSLRAEYDALNERGKAYLGNTTYQLLLLEEKGILTLNQNEANRAVDKIVGIGSVSLNAESRIAAARAIYNTLTATQKALVSNYSVLVTAESQLLALQEAAAKSLTNGTVSGYASSYTYTGKAIKPLPAVRIGTKLLSNRIDYMLTYTANKSCGTAKIVIAGKGSYTGSRTITFKITRASVSAAKVSGVKKKYKRTGKAIKPKAKVRMNGITLKKKRDYSISYKKNKKKGKATITIKGKGNYKGSKKVTFKIS